MVTLETRTRQVPPRAVVLSLLAFAVPVLSALLFPAGFEDYEALLWLTALIPAFLFAFHKGWRGAATALALGMALLSATEAVASTLGQEVPDLLAGVVVAYVAIALGIGWLAELMLRERDEVEDLAFTDTLTRLPNRRHAELFLENEFAAAERGRALAVVLFDLDGFKAYNDTHGHEAGDEALRAFADVLVRTTRRMNLAARFGGEEFVAVLAGSDVKGATVFANRVRKELIGLSLGQGPLTVSAGVAGFTPSMTEPKHLLAAADRALYEAKRDGRDRVVTLGGEMEDPGAWATATEEDGSVHIPPDVVASIGEGRSVLVAEGDAQVRQLLSAYLGSAGFEVSEVADGPDAMRALATEFDVVITDLRLDGVGGEEIIRAVKSRHPLTGVLVLTALQDAHVAADALQAGADRYLFKPFGMPELRAHLVDALAQRDRLVAVEERGRRLSPEGQERADAAREAILNGARALVKAVEVRDPYTAGASERVARYSAIMADELDPDASLLPREPLRIGCELHDVGKIGVPDGVLNKRGTLDAEEMEAIRRHPQTGRKILEPLIDDPIILAITSWHHENWDGTGYPDGLRGAAIPLAARVVAVADALDALTRPRAWRSARSWDAAFAIIRDASATSFDPAVVDACLARADDLRAAGDDDTRTSGDDDA
jgi:putative two-component system response regulator